MQKNSSRVLNHFYSIYYYFCGSLYIIFLIGLLLFQTWLLRAWHFWIPPIFKFGHQIYFRIIPSFYLLSRCLHSRSRCHSSFLEGFSFVYFLIDLHLNLCELSLFFQFIFTFSESWKRKKLLLIFDRNFKYKQLIFFIS